MKLAICLAVTLLIPACSSSRVGVATGHLDQAADMSAAADMSQVPDLATVPDMAQPLPLALGDRCNIGDCAFVTDLTGDPCPSDGSMDCHLSCPLCGAGNTCTVVGNDPDDPTKALTECAGPVCGNGDVVCDPGTLCAVRGGGAHDCLPQCTKNGATVYRTGSNCEARGLFLDELTGKCFVPCFYDQCLDVGDNYCGLPVDLARRLQASKRKHDAQLRAFRAAQRHAAPVAR
jgi:hypothetical protein